MCTRAPTAPDVAGRAAGCSQTPGSRTSGQLLARPAFAAAQDRRSKGTPPARYLATSAWPGSLWVIPPLRLAEHAEPLLRRARQLALVLAPPADARHTTTGQSATLDGQLQQALTHAVAEPTVPPLHMISRQVDQVNDSDAEGHAGGRDATAAHARPAGAWADEAGEDAFDAYHLREDLEALTAFAASPSSAREPLLPRAVDAARRIKEMVSLAVNTKHKGLRALQSSVVAAGVVSPLIMLAEQRHAVAYEALQILCYRHNITCKQIAAGGIVETIAQSLSQEPDLQLQCAMCFLLTGLVAFCEATHQRVITAGLVPQLVALCRTHTTASSDVQVGVHWSALQTRAAAVLRNLSQNTKNHSLLINAGAVQVLADVMRNEKDPVSRINAAVAVACLVGHEEGNPKLQLSEDLVVEMLQVLDTACRGFMHYNTFWTVWKLCQGLASLTVNDRNKELITSHNGVAVLSKVLGGRHHNNEAAHRFALSALWNLAFYEPGKQAIISSPGLVDAIRATLLTTESARTKEVAKGALWTLGLEEDVRSLHEGRSVGQGSTAQSAQSADGTVGEDQGMTVEHIPHVMLSYEWGCQQSVMIIKTELQKNGYQVWMDIDKMSGSTLEAMAKAVEDSAAVIVCVSKRYKESQACRTEAEYAFQQRKKIIPVLMERDYKPTGWLGALMGTRLYFSVHDPRQIPNKMPQVIKELGDAGRLVCLLGTEGSKGSSGGLVALDRPDSWTHIEVVEWLKRIKCGEHAHSFRDKDMDGTALSGLYRLGTDASFLHQVLLHELGVQSLGQRLRLVEELHRLFS